LLCGHWERKGFEWESALLLFCQCFGYQLEDQSVLFVGAEFDRMAKFFDDPYKPLMPIQPLVGAHPERLANEGEDATIALNGALNNHDSGWGSPGQKNV
jgi:hypothetical protein